MTVTARVAQINAIPHDRGLPLIGHTLTAERNPLTFLRKCNDRYGEAVKNKCSRQTILCYLKSIRLQVYIATAMKKILAHNVDFSSESSVLNLLTGSANLNFVHYPFLFVNHAL